MGGYYDLGGVYQYAMMRIWTPATPARASRSGQEPNMDVVKCSEFDADLTFHAEHADLMTIEKPLLLQRIIDNL